jgi:perosamine synthetase
MHPVEISIHRPSLGEPELEAVRRVMESRWVGPGGVVLEFERRLCEIVGARHAIAVANATAALQLALAVSDLQPGDEVITPSMTFVSCPQAILAVGARPVFCEVEPASVNVDVEDVARRITPRTRAIVPVHYGGFPARMDEILTLAREHDLTVVEDAAHAFGSAYGDRMVGTLGDMTCFSFDPVKSVTCAEGGAIATESDGLAEKLRLAGNLGVSKDSWRRRGSERPWHYEVVARGFRFLMTDLHAAIGLAQLERLDELRERRREIVRLYRDGLAGVEQLELVIGEVESAFPFLCAARVLDGRRDALLEWLRRDGIGAWVHFVPNHLQPVFAAYSEPLPATERLYGELVTLPLYHDLEAVDVERVIASVRTFFERSR